MSFTKCSIASVRSMKRTASGGTDFRPVFKAAEALRPKLDILIVMSDGDGEAPKNAPKGTAVVWLIIPNWCARIPAQWGTHLVCSNDHSVVDKILATKP